MIAITIISSISVNPSSCWARLLTNSLPQPSAAN
jgi:hypothetical protein